MHSRKSECIPDTQKTRLARALLAPMAVQCCCPWIEFAWLFRDLRCFGSIFPSSRSRASRVSCQKLSRIFRQSTESTDSLIIFKNANFPFEPRALAKRFRGRYKRVLPGTLGFVFDLFRFAFCTVMSLLCVHAVCCWFMPRKTKDQIAKEQLRLERNKVRAERLFPSSQGSSRTRALFTTWGSTRKGTATQAPKDW